VQIWPDRNSAAHRQPHFGRDVILSHDRRRIVQFVFMAGPSICLPFLVFLG